MTKEELVEFLKENLSVYIETSSNWYTDDNFNLHVKLKLEDEVISEDKITLNCRS